MKRLIRPTIATLALCLTALACTGLVASGCQHAVSDGEDSAEASDSLDENEAEKDANNQDDGATSGKADRGSPSSYDPCGGKSCGDRCTLCSPNDSDCVETQVIKFCQPDGSCAPSQPQCQNTSSCTSDADCASDAYCEKSGSDACSASETGTCTTRPDACPLHFAPVCGCDGKTYSNSCLAQQAGVNVAHDGKCGTSSGCTSDADCGSGEYCEKSGPNVCSASTQGTCSAKHQACPLHIDPVCGCNGKTYDNACLAGSAGVNVAHDGPC